jgi:hypothetical protein
MKAMGKHLKKIRIARLCGGMRLEINYLILSSLPFITLMLVVFFPQRTKTSSFTIVREGFQEAKRTHPKESVGAHLHPTILTSVVTHLCFSIGLIYEYCCFPPISCV